MLEFEKERAGREAYQRRYDLVILAGQALPGIIAHYAPQLELNTKAQTVPEFSAEQIAEMAVAAYEIANTVLVVIDAQESARNAETDAV